MKQFSVAIAGRSLVVREGYKTFGDDPVAYHWLLLPRVSDELARDVARTFDMDPDGYYGGPGREFAGPMGIRHVRARTLLTQRVGLDC